MSIRILNGGTPTPFPGALNAPSNVVASNPTSNSIDLDWTAPAQGDAIEYRIRDNSDDSLVKTVVWPSTGTTISGLNPETAYVFYVVTSDGTAKESPKSNTATETTAVAGPAPTGLYVDKTVASSALYDPVTRTIGSGSEQCYQTIQAAVDAMSSGDAVYIRGAVGGGTETYLENVLIKGSTHPSGTSWSNFCSLQSYPGEWAKVDGQNNAEYTVGKNRNGRDTGNDLAYWKFIRLEITGGIDRVGGALEGSAGLYISGGPFIVRYCYIHDNLAASLDGGSNPAGIVGYCWQDSYVEYCWIQDNGSTTSTDPNFANITILPDYNYADVATNGYPDNVWTTERNVFRYNKVIGSVVGMRDKTYQFFTGRNTNGSDHDDTYKTYGQSWHHNYVAGATRHGILCKTDFGQVHHNIIENISEALPSPHQADRKIYKLVNYNNTIINIDKGITRFGSDFSSGAFVENPALFGYDYNNIITQCSDKVSGANDWLIGTPINVMCYGNRTPFSSPDLTNYICTNNYVHHPAEADPADVFTYNSDYLDVTAYRNETEFEAETDIGSPRDIYYRHSGGTSLFEADGLTTIGSHVMEDTDIIAAGGVGIAHPYLVGVTIPSYVGATDPNNNAWVSIVVDMSVAWLKSQDGDTLPAGTE